jgi:hypothetical protein
MGTDAANSISDVGRRVTFWRNGHFVQAYDGIDGLSDRSSGASDTDAVEGGTQHTSTEGTMSDGGFYRVGGGYLELQFADGRIHHVEFSMPLASALHPAHPIINLNGVRYQRQP